MDKRTSKKSSLEKYGLLNLSPATPNISKKILKVASNQIPYFRTEEFSNILKEDEKMILDLIGAKNGKVVFLTSSGTGAMDAVVSNLINPLESALIINSGSFGQRWYDICLKKDINTLYNFEVPFGKNINFNRLEQIISVFNPSTILTQHCETSSGQLHDLKKLGKLKKKYGFNLIVDAISSFLNDYYNMDKFKVGATIISSQKGLCLLPGLAMIILNKNLAKTKPFKKNNEFYFDFNKYASDLKDMSLPFTPSNVIYQLNPRLNEIVKKGLDKEIQTKQKRALCFRNLIKDLPVEITAETPSNSVTGLRVQRNDIKDFFEKMTKKRIYFSPNKADELMVSHMSHITKKDYKIFVEELKKWLNN